MNTDNRYDLSREQQQNIMNGLTKDGKLTGSSPNPWNYHIKGLTKEDLTKRNAPPEKFNLWDKIKRIFNIKE